MEVGVFIIYSYYLYSVPINIRCSVGQEHVYFAGWAPFLSYRQAGHSNMQIPGAHPTT